MTSYAVSCFSTKRWLSHLNVSSLYVENILTPPSSSQENRPGEMEECPSTEAPEQLDGGENGTRTYITVPP